MQSDIASVEQEPEVTEDSTSVIEDQQISVDQPVSEDQPPVSEDQQPAHELGEEDPALDSPIPSTHPTAIRQNLRGTRIQVPTPRVHVAHPHNTRHQ
jgi:hypothetical protein